MQTTTKKRRPGRPRTRKTPVVSRSRGASEPMEQTIGQDHPRGMSSTGPASEALEPAYIEPVERPIDQAKLDELIFMEDMLTVYVHEDPNPQADPYPFVGNGGDRNTVYLRRGEHQQIRRKYVEVLARSKITTFKQQKTVDDMGNDKYIHLPRTTLRIPFSVTQDPAGEKGRLWLQGVLAEA